jgi:hypothetical protein
VKQGIIREQLLVHGHEPVFAGQLHGTSGRMVFTRPTMPDSSLTLMPWGGEGGSGEDIFNSSPGQVSGRLVRFLDHVYEHSFGDVFSVISVHVIPIIFPTMIWPF